MYDNNIVVPGNYPLNTPIGQVQLNYHHLSSVSSREKEE